jgi:hypothetical protein
MGLVLLLASLLAAGGAGQAQAQVQVSLLGESKLWIEGTSTVNSFTCKAGELEGSAALHAPGMVRTASNGQARAEVTVPVKAFDCGKTRMNRDFYEALKASAHPVIEYRLDRVEVVSGPEAGAGPYRLRAFGRLRIAGAERRVETNVQGLRAQDGRFRVEGSQPLLMTDFGIVPPTALMGLVKAHDRIVVRFSFLAGTEKITAAK